MSLSFRASVATSTANAGVFFANLGQSPKVFVYEDPENQKNLVNRAKTAATIRRFLD